MHNGQLYKMLTHCATALWWFCTPVQSYRKGNSLEVDITNRISRYFKFGAIGFVLLILLFGAGLYFYRYRTADIELTDAVIKGDTIEVKTKTSGVISDILAADGSTVDVATPILTLTVSIDALELKQLEEAAVLARHNLTEIQKGIAVMRALPDAPSVDSASLAAAQERLDRMNKLYEMGAVSAVKRDQAQAEYQAALAASGNTVGGQYRISVQPASPEVMKQSETALKQAEVALANAKRTVDAATVKSPVSGILHPLPLSVGQAVEEDTTIAWVERQDTFHIEATAVLSDKGNFSVGQPVQYMIQGQSVQGMVQEIKEEGTSIRLYISIPENVAGFTAGDKLNVRILR